MSFRLAAFVALVWAVGLSAQSPAQYSQANVEGVVLDAVTERPISGAAVSTGGPREPGAFTDAHLLSAQELSLTLHPGERVITNTTFEGAASPPDLSSLVLELDTVESQFQPLTRGLRSTVSAETRQLLFGGIPLRSRHDPGSQYRASVAKTTTASPACGNPAVFRTRPEIFVSVCDNVSRRSEAHPGPQDGPGRPIRGSRHPTGPILARGRRRRRVRRRLGFHGPPAAIPDRPSY